MTATFRYRPKIGYFYKSNLLNILLLLFLVFAFFYFRDVKASIPALIVALLYTAIISYLIYDYLLSRSMSWAITEEQLVYQRGIIAVEVDYLELYRINDFREYSSVLDRLFRLKNIVISSTDKSHPEIAIRGISIQTDILTYLREQVELNKRNRRIYEMGNH